MELAYFRMKSLGEFEKNWPPWASYNLEIGGMAQKIIKKSMDTTKNNFDKNFFYPLGDFRLVAISEKRYFGI